jgi:hypothetical protein
MTSGDAAPLAPETVFAWQRRLEQEWQRRRVQHRTPAAAMAVRLKLHGAIDQLADRDDSAIMRNQKE